MNPFWDAFWDLMGIGAAIAFGVIFALVLVLAFTGADDYDDELPPRPDDE